MTKFKTDKTNAYEINNNSLRRIVLAQHTFEWMAILANSFADDEIIVVTHGNRDGTIDCSTVQESRDLYYTELANIMPYYFPAIRKINLICCYNAFMKNTFKKGIQIHIPESVKTSATIALLGLRLHKVVCTIELLLEI